jgi:hypothetical protein
MGSGRIRSVTGERYMNDHAELDAVRDPSRREKSLFRYRSLDRLTHLRSILLEHEVYAPLVGSGGFNDPCELFYSVEFGWDEVRAREHVRSLKANPQSKISDTVKESVIAGGEITPQELRFTMEMLDRLTEDQIIDMMRAGAAHISKGVKTGYKNSQREIDRKTVGVCSLTECGDSPYMSWYYADQHRGVCLEFSTDVAPFDRAVPVSYVNSPPVFRSFSDPYLQQVARMQTKGRAWSEEREWRLLGHPSTGLSLRFEPEALLSVCFCTSADSSKETEVLQMIAERNTRQKPIPVYRFQPNRSAYTYDRISVNPSHYSTGAPNSDLRKAASGDLKRVLGGRLLITLLGAFIAENVAAITGHVFPGTERITFWTMLMIWLVRNWIKGRREYAAFF